MTGHYMYGCDLAHFQHLLEVNKADLDPKQAGRIEECLRYSKFLSRWAKVERFFWDKRIRNVVIDKPPLFILGHWRSGTTYLFNLLSCDPAVSYMDSMTTFTFHNFLLLRYHLPKHYRGMLTGDRFGDDMEFLPNSPQEECYAIANCIDETFTHLITFPKNYRLYMDYAFEDCLTPEQRPLVRHPRVSAQKDHLFPQREAHPVQKPGQHGQNGHAPRSLSPGEIRPYLPRPLQGAHVHHQYVRGRHPGHDL